MRKNSLEIAVSAASGRIDIDLGELIDAAAADGSEELPVRAVRTAAIERLPDHHSRPSDRLLLAQAIEQRQLVTRDDSLWAYEGIAGLTLISE